MVTIGIDLGTTNCCMCIIDKDGKPKVIANQIEERTTPSCVYIGSEEVLIGKAALTKSRTHPLSTVYDVKRILGKSINDPSLAPLIPRWAFQVISKHGEVKICISIKGSLVTYDPEEFSGMILKELRVWAEKREQVNITRAVLTVPTYFSDLQRALTVKAGKYAGFEEVRLLNEPTAAALAYNIDKVQHFDLDKTVFVFDLGGGTFDVSVLMMRKDNVKVLAIDGDANLGGNDITLKLYHHLCNQFPSLMKKMGANVWDFQDKQSMRSYRLYKRFYEKCEDWKKDLSMAVDIEDEFDEFDIILSRHEFDELNEDLFNDIIDIVRRCLESNNIDKDKIDEVLLIGGSSKIPYLQEKLEEIFGKKLSNGISSDEAVAIGAAVVASKWDGSGKFDDLNFNDICPYNLGVETHGNKMNVVIRKHTPLPATATKLYTTTIQDQPSIQVKIFSGDDESTLNNRFLGSLRVSDLPPGPPGSARVQETFICDESGILTVEAVEESTGCSKILTVTLDKMADM